MHQERFQWLVILVVLFMVCALGLIVHRQSQLIREFTKVSTNTQTAPVESAPREQAAGREIARAAVPTDVADQPPTIEFIQRCVDGQVTTRRSEWNGETYSFCVGKNQLFVREEGKETLLNERMVREAKDAPLLLRPYLLKNALGRPSNKVLVSYAPEVCTTTSDCGVGLPTNYVAYEYAVGSGKVRELNYFPRVTFGGGVWNASFTKAIFLPLTCGGAGCSATSLIGYNLERDQLLEDLTTDKAAEPGIESPDVSGRPLPMWSIIEWTSDTDFRASIADPSGTTRWITGQL